MRERRIRGARQAAAFRQLVAITVGLAGGRWGRCSSMTERYFLRPIAPEEFEAYFEVPFEAFNKPEWHAETIDHERKIFEFDRSLAAFDGDAIVGTTAAYSYQLTVPGGVVGAGGVTLVSVLPSHRRRGILSAMMRHQLADIAARGEPVAALYASESVIYGRYGYGCASSQLSLTVRRGEGTLKPAAGSAGPGGSSVRLRGGQPADVRTELAHVYDSVCPH